MPPLSPPYNFSSIMLLLIPFTTLALAIPSSLSSMILLIPITATMTSPLYDSSDSRETALNMRGYTPTPLPLQTFLSPPVKIAHIFGRHAAVEEPPCTARGTPLALPEIDLACYSGPRTPRMRLVHLV